MEFQPVFYDSYFLMLGFIEHFGISTCFIACFLVCDAFAGRWIPLDEPFSSEQKVENRASLAPDRVVVAP